MRHTIVLAAVSVACVVTPLAQDWNQWRGPSRSGVTAAFHGTGHLARQAAQGLGEHGRDRPFLARRLGHPGIRLHAGRRR